MNTKLIVVEGLPGSGKSTTARFIADGVRKRNRESLLYLENSLDHPVEIDVLATMDEGQYRQFTAQIPSYQPYLEEIVEIRPEGYFFHYRRLPDLFGETTPPGLVEALYQYDAYNTMEVPQYHAVMQARWREFYSGAADQQGVYIFECCVLQNPLTFYIMFHDEPVDVAQSHILGYAQSVEGLDPTLVFLKSKNPRLTLQRVIPTRPQAWTDSLVEYVSARGYGKAHGLSGLEGVFQFYERMQAIEDESIKQLQWNKLILDTSEGEWEKYQEIIIEFLDEWL